MKLCVLSDLHLDVSFSLPNPNIPEDVDAVLIAGDLASATSSVSRHTVQAYLGRVKHPTYVIAGNHDYYLQDIDDNISLKDAIEGSSPNVHYLYKETADLGTLRIIGVPLWAAMDWSELSYTPQIAQAFLPKGVMCALQIRCKGTFLENVQRLYHDHLAWLRAAVDRAMAENRVPVVMTHFAPTTLSIAHKYKNNSLNPYFANNLPPDDCLFQKVALWIHGHTHNSLDGMEGRTRIICNPRGYGPKENRAYNSNLIVEV